MGVNTSSAVESVLHAAVALSSDERAELVERLIQTLDKEHQEELDSAWSAEIERRLQEIESGKARLIPGDEALRLIRERRKV